MTPGKQICPKCGAYSSFAVTYVPPGRRLLFWPRGEYLVRDCEFCGYEFTEEVTDGTNS